ncbi:MAG: nucleotide-binding protein [Candidatus Freyarchaeota archaeon]|nr:nucleotide-binding protein [Candidatus Jordarchaeia archaeon]MBS7268490.1 nucleotide-binding protein [Candidatus Jordarchaeia archaeon]MBS7278518.1 nucleotide-binding protein [Candidatus Jordarchaeia archaeon]
MGTNNSSPVLKVILDTNFLMVPFEIGIDIISELDRLIKQKYEIIILKGTIDELKGLSQNPKLKIRKAAKLALEMAERYKVVEPANQNGNLDDLIVRFSKNSYCVVATNDRNLRRKLKSEGIPTIFVRQKSHLQMEGHL